jgi:hypothetical protein
MDGVQGYVYCIGVVVFCRCETRHERQFLACLLLA